MENETALQKTERLINMKLRRIELLDEYTRAKESGADGLHVEIIKFQNTQLSKEIVALEDELGRPHDTYGMISDA